ncbi:MAG: SIS domain-containing protein [Acidobacteriota bacterium]
MMDSEEYVSRYYDRLVAGNGGSAAISSHAALNLTKPSSNGGDRAVRGVLRCISLSSCTSTITALGNDVGYADTFSTQLAFYAKPKDALLLISSSGDSPNVVKACEMANEMGIPTIAFVGFDGGRLKKIARHCVWIPINNYGMVEEIHQSLMHVLAQYIRHRNEATF